MRPLRVTVRVTLPAELDQGRRVRLRQHATWDTVACCRKTRGSTSRLDLGAAPPDQLQTSTRRDDVRAVLAFQVRAHDPVAGTPQGFATGPHASRYADRMSTVEALPPGRPIHGQMVMLPTPPPGGFTAADLPALIEAVDARFELLDGEVLMVAPATHWHDEVIDILKHALRQIAPQSLVIATEKGIDLGTTVPEPDVLVVSREVVTSGSLVFQPSDVHLAIEVVSPGTTTKDRTLRPAQYASAGIKCFWRVENEDDAIVVYTFELLPEGGYAPTGVFRTRVKVDRPFPIDIELPEVTW